MLPETVSINPPVHDVVAAFGIAGIAIIVAVAWVALFSGGSQRRMAVLSGAVSFVLAVSAFAAWSGKLSQFNHFPPPMAGMVISVLLMGFGSGLSKLGRDAAANVSMTALIGLQSFRFPLELVMHHAYTAGIMPVQLSFSGYNFDILIGAGAIVLFALLKSGRDLPRSIVWAWNIWGSYCLLAIAGIAVATSPVVRLFGDQPENLNTWVLYFPYVWLPVVLVTVAISSHVVIWRKLLAGPHEP